jgi:hypothetical protein
MRISLVVIALVGLFKAGLPMQALPLPTPNNIPVDRLISNLERRLVQNTNDLKTLFYLGRLYAMSALGTTDLWTQATIETPLDAVDSIGLMPDSPNHLSAARSNSDRWTKSLSFFQRAVAALSAMPTNTPDRSMRLAVKLGSGWTLAEAGRTNDAIRELRSALKLAWAEEVVPTDRSLAGEFVDTLRESFDRREWAGWQSPPFQAYFTAATIAYLIPLLDPLRDGKEIADLESKLTKLQRRPRAISPIVIPIGPKTHLADLVNPTASVAFDLDGSGIEKRWGWTTDKAAWLAWDLSGTGRIQSALQLFGEVTFWIFWSDGYDALDALDDNGDGALTGVELNGLVLWQDSNGNGISEPGEVRAVSDWGIVRIECHAIRHSTGIQFNPAGVTMIDGETRPTYDWYAPCQSGEKAASPRQRIR